MFIETFKLMLRLSVLYILVGCEDALSNPNEDRTIQNDYFSAINSLPAFLEYLPTLFLADEVEILDKEYEEEAVDAEYSSFQYRGHVALTPEEIVEQILKVEHELDEYNVNGEL